MPPSLSTLALPLLPALSRNHSQPYVWPASPMRPPPQHLLNPSINSYRSARHNRLCPALLQSMQNLRLSRISFKRHTHMNTKTYPREVSPNVKEIT
ncbi:hypothetical protein Taro_032046 [Colocasia esculenta]|uniref:Uncharacterized protein n=1 Tax=Colocasia esculenta TaxID=4460 RepID=A0A843W2Q6_COLES|nr:hypothetical protein [Colocasia esculenta]